MNQYKKVTEDKVLKKYYEIQNNFNKIGWWCD